MLALALVLVLLVVYVLGPQRRLNEIPGQGWVAPLKYIFLALHKQSARIQPCIGTFLKNGLKSETNSEIMTSRHFKWIPLHENSLSAVFWTNL